MRCRFIGLWLLVVAVSAAMGAGAARASCVAPQLASDVTSAIDAVPNELSLTITPAIAPGATTVSSTSVPASADVTGSPTAAPKDQTSSRALLGLAIPAVMIVALIAVRRSRRLRPTRTG